MISAQRLLPLGAALMLGACASRPPPGPAVIVVLDRARISRPSNKTIPFASAMRWRIQVTATSHWPIRRDQRTPRQVVPRERLACHERLIPPRRRRPRPVPALPPRVLPVHPFKGCYQQYARARDIGYQLIAEDILLIADTPVSTERGDQVDRSRRVDAAPNP